LSGVVRSARGPAAVRSTQWEGEKKVAFGRLGLDERSNEKWTYGSPKSSISAGQPPRIFQSAEVWAPNWNICTREQRPPDVLVTLERPFSSDFGFDQVMLVAIGADLASGETVLDAMMDELWQKHTACLVGRIVRPWAEEVPAGGGEGFTNSVQDFASIGLYYPDMKWPIDLEQTSWRGWATRRA
jgi:hypothetical protein